jgi:hypothetical protein
MTETLPEISAEQAEVDLRAAISPASESKPVETAKSEPKEQQAAQKEVAEVKQPNETQSGTPAAAEKAPVTTDKTETTKPEAKKQSDFAKNQERLDKTWKSVNERKAQLDTTEATLKQREQALTIKEQKIALEAAKAKSKFTPEQYEAASAAKANSIRQLELQAKGLEAQASEFDDSGLAGKAELARQQAQDIREQAAGEKYSAKQLKEMAENLRKNPDPTLAQHQAQLAQHKQHYLIEAAKKWPDLAKEGSEFQKKMTENLQAAAQQGLIAEENPVMFYHVARLVAAESEAARVPELVQKLGVAEAKVKELEALTAVGGGKTVVQGQPEGEKSFGQMTVDEQEASLRRMMGR